MRHKPTPQSGFCLLPAEQENPVFFNKPEKTLYCRLVPLARRALALFDAAALKLWKPLCGMVRALDRILMPGRVDYNLAAVPDFSARPGYFKLRLTPRRLLAGLCLAPAAALFLAAATRGVPAEAQLVQSRFEIELAAEGSPGSFNGNSGGASGEMWRHSRKIVPVGFAESVPRLERQSNVIAWDGQVAPGPRDSLLALKKQAGRGQPVMLCQTGSLDIPKLTDIALSGPSNPYDNGKNTRIATGEQAVETLLAEFSYSPEAPGQLFAVPLNPKARWQDGGYADDLQTLAFLQGPRLYAPTATPPYPGASGGPSCRADRVELAAWLAQVRENNLAMGLTQVQRASKYSAYVERYSSDYALPPSLVYAIMRIESSFNPNARSVANALGLMQVVPQTAGGEVHAFLTGKRGTPGSDLLFTPEQNIQYGTAYLYLLKNRHFKGVTNHISRELCIIAAYNGGPNAVFRTFDRDKEKAIAKINSYTPDELYRKLVQSLPSQETRDYVVKVVEARDRFRHSSLSF